MATFEPVDVYYPIAHLLELLPELGDEWHVEDRRKWLEALDAVLASTYRAPQTVTAPTE